MVKHNMTKAKIIHKKLMINFQFHTSISQPALFCFCFYLPFYPSYLSLHGSIPDSWHCLPQGTRIWKIYHEILRLDMKHTTYLSSLSLFWSYLNSMLVSSWNTNGQVFTISETQNMIPNRISPHSLRALI